MTAGKHPATFYELDFCHVANYNFYMGKVYKNNFGEIIKQQRLTASLTLKRLAEICGVSSSHLGRIERGERFPSSRTVRKIAKPLGFNENELLVLADYLTDSGSTETKGLEKYHLIRALSGLDLDVARVLAREPIEMQRAIIRILRVLKDFREGPTAE